MIPRKYISAPIHTHIYMHTHDQPIIIQIYAPVNIYKRTHIRTLAHPCRASLYTTINSVTHIAIVRDQRPSLYWHTCHNKKEKESSSVKTAIHVYSEIRFWFFFFFLWSWQILGLCSFDQIQWPIDLFSVAITNWEKKSTIRVSEMSHDEYLIRGWPKGSLFNCYYT